MSKKRPRIFTLSVKSSPTYWRARLFKNTFTYKSRRVEVSAWSVKIQMAGRRRTFSLRAHDQAQAAREACEIYQTLVTHGWEAVTSRGSGVGAKANTIAAANPGPAPRALDSEYWKRRLLRRHSLDRPHAEAGRTFAVRIEHERTGHYFPLATDNVTVAAGRARQIYQTVVNSGWAAAAADFPRELTLALRWLDNPLAWTYTTIHTVKQRVRSRPRSAPVAVTVIEADEGIRLALAACINHQEGFRCEITFADVIQARREISRYPLHLVLANSILGDQTGAAGLATLQRIAPQLAGVLYSVYSDSDELFSTAPGGAVGYLLTRTSPFRMLEPLAQAVGPITRDYINARIRDYFQNLIALPAVGPASWELAKLTPRELEILTRLSKGGVAKDIANTLGISLWTVHGHVKNILEKLNVHTRTEAVVKFLQK